MGKEEARDSWTKAFDPSQVVHEVKAVTPPSQWELTYIGEPFVKEKLQKVCDICCQPVRSYGCLSGIVAAAMQAGIRVITRGTRTSNRVVLLTRDPLRTQKDHAVEVVACAVANHKDKVYQVDLASVKSTWQTLHLKQLLTYIGKLENAIVFIDDIDSLFIGEVDFFVGNFNRITPLRRVVSQWINGIKKRST
jgi:hypothetical protein